MVEYEVDFQCYLGCSVVENRLNELFVIRAAGGVDKHLLANCWLS